MKIPVILDTDIGDDIDDALALAVIFGSPELDLRGVTTVFHVTEKRAVLTQYMAKTFGRTDVPIVAGLSQPLSGQLNPSGWNTQFEILQELEDTTWKGRTDAVDFIIETVKQNAANSSTRLTLITIGALTNIAQALTKAPEIVSQINIVVMGGLWSRPEPEWNIVCDPEAADIVFRSGAPINMCGLDVTLKCQLEEAHIEQIAAVKTEKAAFMTRLLRLWQKGAVGHAPILHDPLAVITIFDDCVQWKEGRVEIPLEGEKRAVTQLVEGDTNCQVAAEVDTKRAVEVFMQRILESVRD